MSCLHTRRTTTSSSFSLRAPVATPFSSGSIDDEANETNDDARLLTETKKGTEKIISAQDDDAEQSSLPVVSLEQAGPYLDWIKDVVPSKIEAIVTSRVDKLSAAQVRLKQLFHSSCTAMSYISANGQA